MYKLGQNDILTGQPMCILNLDTNTSIPFCEDNTDYQAYLKWLEESPDNKALPAEEAE